MQKQGVMFRLLDGILQAVDEIDSRSVSLDDVLDNKKIIPEDMRRTAAYWLFSIYRYRIDIERYIRDFSSKGRIKKRLFDFSVAAAAHCAFQDRIVKEVSVNAMVEYAKEKFGVSESRFVNALLRRICREQYVFSARLPYDTVKRWKKVFGDDFIVQAEKCLAAEPVQTFRLRPGFELNDQGAEKTVDENLKDFAFYQTEKIDRFIESDIFKNGGIYIQDCATGYALELLKKYVDRQKGRFIDVCGAPGGKSIMFHDLFPEWEIFVGDRSSKRQQRTSENLERCGVKAELLILDASKDDFEQKYDVVFADVPCSNSGVFRKRPDALYRSNEKVLAEIVKIQRDILENISKAVSDDGLLLYSTCSIEEAEDNLQTAEFCRRHPEFELLEESLLLPSLQHDGAYCACLRKRRS